MRGHFRTRTNMEGVTSDPKLHSHGDEATNACCSGALSGLARWETKLIQTLRADERNTRAQQRIALDLARYQLKKRRKRSKSFLRFLALSYVPLSSQFKYLNSTAMAMLDVLHHVLVPLDCAPQSSVCCALMMSVVCAVWCVASPSFL